MVKNIINPHTGTSTFMQGDISFLFPTLKISNSIILIFPNVNSSAIN